MAQRAGDDVKIMINVNFIRIKRKRKMREIRRVAGGGGEQISEKDTGWDEMRFLKRTHVVKYLRTHYSHV